MTAMDSLEQYLSLYRDNRELIDSHSSPVLNRLREAAYDSLKRNGFPEKGSENYLHSDIGGMLAPDYGLNLARVQVRANPMDSFRCDVPNMSTSLFFLVNDTCARTQLSLRGLPDGVLAGSLREFSMSHPDTVGKYYGSAADMGNSVTALNTMFAQDGFLLYVPKGVKIEKPIQLVSIFHGAAPLMAVRRILVVLEDDAEASLLVCDHTQNPDVDFMSVQTVELIAGRNSRLGYYEIEESSERTSRLSTLYVSQFGGSSVTADTVTLFNGTTRNEYYCSLLEPHAELELLGLAIEDRRRGVVTHSLIDHAAKDCRSNELFKYVAEDESEAVFSGRILVRPGASGTEAYQANRNILGSDNALIYSKPQLEIYNDDVKCSHGTATGKLDENQIFYMRARGVELDDARRMLKQAFMSDVIERVHPEALRDRLHSLVERRFSGDFPLCKDCGGGNCFSSKITE